VFAALGIQHATRMRHIVIHGLSGSTIFFHIISQTTQFSRGEKLQDIKMCGLIFSTTFAWNISHSKKNWARQIKNVYWSSCTVSVIPVNLNDNWIFSAVVQKIREYQISWKSLQWEPSCSMRTDKQTRQS